MASSPYLTQQLKDYIRTHKIEETISDTINDVLAQQHPDPYSFIIANLEKFSQGLIQLIDIEAFESINNNHQPAIQLLFNVSYRQKDIQVLSNVTFSQDDPNQQGILYDSDDQARFKGQGLLKACNFIKKNITKKLKNMNITSQKQIDSILVELLTENKNIGINAIFSISFSLSQVAAQLFNQSHVSYLRTLNDVKINPQPSIFVNILTGGAQANSKCKINKFRIIINEQSNKLNYYNIANAICGNVRKTICSGKLGEAALKYYQDGSFICSADTINENLKILVDAITSSGYKDQVSIGIVWNADSFYKADIKKYELENPKQPLDIDQQIDFYFKMVQENPLIKYMEDPVVSDNTESWQKLMNKFKETGLKIGSRKLYNSLDQIKHLTVQEERQEQNDSEKVAQDNKNLINLDYAIYSLSEQFRTFSDFISYWQSLALKKHETKIILTEPISDVCDNTFINLSFAFNNLGVCLNPPVKFEKVQKYNELLKLSLLQ